MKTGWKPAALMFFGGMLLLHGLVFWNLRHLISDGYPDFTAFYTAGRIVDDGLGRQLYDEATQWRIQQQFAAAVKTRRGPLPYIHPPFEALLFAPFALFSYATAYFLWNAINVGIALGVPLLLRPHLRILEEFPLWVGLLSPFAFTPVFMALLQGQDSLLLLLFYSLAFIALKKGAEFQAGCWLGLGLFKLHLVLPFVVILLFRRKMKAVGGFVATGTALALLSLAVVGWTEFVRYPERIWWLEQQTGRGLVLPGDTPNLRGLLEGSFSNWMPSHAAILLIAFSSAILILLAAAQGRRVPAKNDTLANLIFCYCVVATVLVSYHVFVYDLSILLLPIFLISDDLLSNNENRAHNRLAVIGPMAVLLLGPTYLLLWLQFHALKLLAIVLLWWLWGLGREISRRSSLPVAGAVSPG